MIGLVVLVPSLTWLFRLTLRGSWTRGRTVIRTLVLFAVGAAVLFIFDSTITITAGILLLVAAMVSGIFATATPGVHAGEREDAG